MAYEFTHRRLVEFADTDMAGIMHFSNYFRFMEVTEHAMFRANGLSLHWQDAKGTMGGFARVKADCEYRRPLIYLDEVEMHLLVRRVGQRSISYDVFFYALSNAHPDAVLSESPPLCTARGMMTVVPVGRRSNQERMRAVDMPPSVRDTLEVAPQSLFESHENAFQKSSPRNA